MGYTDVDVRVTVDVLGPMNVVSGPTVLYHSTIHCRDLHRLRACPNI